MIDWYSRKVLSWRLCNTMDGGFCCEVLDEALSLAAPQVFNTDQGSQYTATAFTTRLAERGVAISMDGRGRALDNVFIERLWRSVKYEDVYLRDYQSVRECEAGLEAYFAFYNSRRRHQSLGRRTPAEVYAEGDKRPPEKMDEIARNNAETEPEHQKSELAQASAQHL